MVQNAFIDHDRELLGQTLYLEEPLFEIINYESVLFRYVFENRDIHIHTPFVMHFVYFKTRFTCGGRTTTDYCLKFFNYVADCFAFYKAES
jgi:hypothetical protein